MRKILKTTIATLSLLLITSLVNVSEVRAEEVKKNDSQEQQLSTLIKNPSRIEKQKIEILKKKYEMSWFYKKYCNPDPKEEYGENAFSCYMTKEQLQNLSMVQLKSLLLNYSYDLITSPLDKNGVKTKDNDFLKLIKNELAFNSQTTNPTFIELKKLIYSPEFLKYNTIGCSVIEQLPTNFTNYREIILEQIKLQNSSENHGNIAYGSGDIIYLQCLNDENLKKDLEIAIESIKHSPSDFFDLESLIKEISKYLPNKKDEIMNYFKNDVTVLNFIKEYWGKK